MNVPEQYKDSVDSLKNGGFEIGSTWYHGTTSGLLPNIQSKGLVGSGDVDFNAATAKAMKTIGAEFTESKDPIFLTPSKEMAYFWAQEKTNVRNQRFGGDEKPVVLEVSLPETLQASVHPDVGAAAMFMTGEHQYLTQLDAYYVARGVTLKDSSGSGWNRESYLTQFGLAYLDHTIPPESVKAI